LFAGREPYTGEGLHPGDQPIEHRDPQRAAGLKRMHAHVEISTDIVLLAERRPPDVADSLRVGNPLRRRVAAEPIEVEVHRVVDDVVHGEVDESVASAFVELIVRPLVSRAPGAVDIPVLTEQFGAMAAARAGWTASGDPFERDNSFRQMILFE